jgi:hypothetical protein
MISASDSFKKLTPKSQIKKRLHSVSGHSVIIIDKTLMQRLGITEEDFLMQSISEGGILLLPCREELGYSGVAE